MRDHMNSAKKQRECVNQRCYRGAPLVTSLTSTLFRKFSQHLPETLLFISLKKFFSNGFFACFRPRGVLPYQEVGAGGLDLTPSLEAKFGARPGQVHQIRGKTWEVLLPQDTKVGKNPNFGVIFEIQRAKFGVFVTFIF